MTLGVFRGWDRWPGFGLGLGLGGLDRELLALRMHAEKIPNERENPTLSFVISVYKSSNVSSLL